MQKKDITATRGDEIKNKCHPSNKLGKNTNTGNKIAIVKHIGMTTFMIYWDK